MAPGARSKFGAPCSKLRSFGSSCIVLKKAHGCYIVGTFRHPSQSFGASRSDLAPGELCSLASLVTPLYATLPANLIAAYPAQIRVKQLFQKIYLLHCEH